MFTFLSPNLFDSNRREFHNQDPGRRSCSPLNDLYFKESGVGSV